MFNVVQGLGAEAGAPLVAHPDVARVSFTGSVATGRAVAAAAGGAAHARCRWSWAASPPLLVFADADLDLAVTNAVEQYDNAGQVCLAGSRLLVRGADRGRVHGPAARPRRRAAAGRPAGRGHRHRPEHQPARTCERVDGFVQRAVADGAQACSAGGANAELGGLYYQPTLLAGAQPGAEILTEEVFGPVLTLQTFGTEDEAVALANEHQLRARRDAVHRRPRPGPSGWRPGWWRAPCG